MGREPGHVRCQRVEWSKGVTANRELVYAAAEDRGSLSIAKAARLTTVLPINFQTKRLGLELLRAR
jgi:hypothetical protein